jgi:hypothetical protein
MAAAGGVSPTRSQLVTYLAKVRPLNMRYDTAAEDANVGIHDAIRDDPTGIDEMNASAGAMRGLASKMSRIRPPTELSGPHSSFVRGIRLHARLTMSQADFIESGDLQGAVDIADSLGVQATDNVRQWRSEVIYRLRRAGMTVPLWVKNVGR